MTAKLAFFVFFVISQASMAQDKMSLNTFLAKVKEQNLDLKVEVFKSDATQAKAIGLSIPPPMVGINQMQMKDTGASANGFEVNQMIPFPTKLTSEHSARQFEASSQDEKRLAKENEIMAEARLSYFSLWAVQEKKNLLIERQEVIKNHLKLARSTARSDSFAGIHVLKAESDLDFLENDIEAEDQEITERQAVLANLLNVNAADFKIKAEEPPLTLPPKSFSTEKTHQIQALKFDLERMKSKESEARSSWFPDLNLKYREMGATPMFPQYSEVMVGITLPFVFFWEPNANSEMAGAERMQAEAELEKQKRNIESKVATLLSRADSLKRQILTLKEKLIPKAEKRMRLVHNLAPRDMETLQDHRETMEAFPELKMKALMLRLEYEQTISQLEKYFANKGSSHE